MFGRDKFEPSTEVLEVTSRGPILRVAFAGTHRDGVGALVGDYVREAMRIYEPAAVVLDFLHFKYRFGNDIGGIVQAFVGEGVDGEGAIRPTAIVARGATAKSLLSLLRPTKVTELFGVTFSEDVGSAVEHLRARLGVTTA